LDTWTVTVRIEMPSDRATCLLDIPSARQDRTSRSLAVRSASATPAEPTDAARSATPAPLVLLSHGTGGAVDDLSWLAEALAAEGLAAEAFTKVAIRSA